MSIVLARIVLFVLLISLYATSTSRVHMNVNDSSAFPGPFPTCDTGSFRSSTSRQFISHHRQCQNKPADKPAALFPGPCPYCGLGSYESSNCRKFTTHFTQCKKCKKKRTPRDNPPSASMPSAKVARNKTRGPTFLSLIAGITNSSVLIPIECHVC